MRTCLTAPAIVSILAMAAVVTPAKADTRWRSPALVHDYGPYYGYRYPADYRRYRRPYEYGHHYGLTIYGSTAGRTCRLSKRLTKHCSGPLPLPLNSGIVRPYKGPLCSRRIGVMIWAMNLQPMKSSV
jgi:hypothetical protein